LNLAIQYPARVASWGEFATRFRILTKEPKRGRPFLLLRGRGKDHMGWTAEDLPGDRFRAYECNTNDEGSRDGYEACERTRTIDASTWFIDLDGFDLELRKLAEAKKAKP
jgi:hypothetical protein